MKVFFLLLCCLAFSLLVVAHEGHHAEEKVHIENIQSQETGKTQSWIQWIGSFHLVLLHFPIALINMLAVSEVLLIWYRSQVYEFSSRFLLLSSAILAPPTALLGFIYSYSAPYSGLEKTFLFWHMWFGIFTAIFAIVLVFIRTKSGIGKLYYACLLLLLLLVNITGFIGGEMTF